ncbi:outer membrane beta-barrel protein [Devosia epidermidihirudinis]|uniref:outer membrane beta-barrel protein n=1 Tax=Devosia epidermidihirudinis TaxID=1293439 RepID=UPI00069821C3|nr:outer membrane beta-barrel protein [Devosia epidermidihirudinis]
MALCKRHILWRSGAIALAALCAAAPALADSQLVAGDGSAVDNDRLLPGQYPASPVADWSAEPYDPFFDIDWSIGLRGTYTKAKEDERFDIRLTPSVSLEHIGSRSAVSLAGSVEVTRPQDGKIDITGLRLNGSAGYALDSDTRIISNANFSLSRELPGTPGLGSNIAEAPQTIKGGVDVGITRQFGRFNVGVTGGVARSAYGPTTYVGGTSVDNWERNAWMFDAGLRVGYQVTPIFEVFGQAGLGRDIFDEPQLTAKRDATDAALRAGVTGRWNDVLEATVSTGVGLRRFDAAGLDEVVTQLYDASVTYRPDETLRLTAGLSTGVTPSGPLDGGTTRVSYAANAELGYTVNSWLALRASADWRTASFVGSSDTETGYGFGLGADYRINRHTAVTADYGYSQSDTTADGIEDAHRVAVGVTIKR